MTARPEVAPCGICHLAKGQVAASIGGAVVVVRGPPVPGREAVVSLRRHVCGFEAVPEEVTDLWAAVKLISDRFSREAPRSRLHLRSELARGEHFHIVVTAADLEPADRRTGRRPPLSTGAPHDALLRHIRPLIAGADVVEILAAFVQDSGLRRLGPDLHQAARRGARIRILTGDYLHLTDAAALTRLLDWEEDIRALREQGDDAVGSLRAGVVELASLNAMSFHPKAWRFEGPGFGSAFVGSSNLSQAALDGGVEWNLRVDRELDPVAYGEVRSALEDVWRVARPITADWIAEYVRRAPPTLAWADIDPESPHPAPEPSPIQQDALANLAVARAEGARRALVVVATGLGKTFLAAFDVLDFMRQRQLAEPNVLFVAHRAEILTQARATFRRVFPVARLGLFVGDSDSFDASVVFASIQKLARPGTLERLRARRFDYVVIDEAHHSAAGTYRRVLAALDATFVLGLTATPDRADEADILELFDDHEVFRCDLGEGIQRGLLSPFAYLGVKDTVDYAPIPWRSGRFDPGELAAAVQTEARMETLWRAWEAHAGTRTLVFCCSIEHARFTASWLATRGVRIAMVHSGPGSDSRAGALELLEMGGLDAVCSVDILNEGIDVPNVDRVVMLRPTESTVLFLQQLGRGLRRAPGKARLQVVDFVGNHRIFARRLRTLLETGLEPTSLSEMLEGRTEPRLPPGCSVELELEAKDLLKQLLPAAGEALTGFYREQKALRARRVTAGELVRLGYNVRSLDRRGGWFAFVEAEDDLSGTERKALAHSNAWFAQLEMPRSRRGLKWLVLLVLLDEEALWTGLPLHELAALAHAGAVRRPDLAKELLEIPELGPDPARAPSEARTRFWREGPIAEWTSPSGGRPLFTLKDGRVQLRVVEPNDPATQVAFTNLTRELVDARLAEYRRRRTAAPTGSGFEVKLIHAGGKPIIQLPSRERFANVPEGWTPVRLPDGRLLDFNFVKYYVNVARTPGGTLNVLPELMRQLFGPTAGLPGTSNFVRLTPTPDGWVLTPSSAHTVTAPVRRPITAYPSFRAAAGLAGTSNYGEPDSETVTLPLEVEADVFAVRADGESMKGGPAPIRGGDWVILRRAPDTPASRAAGRIVLVGAGDPDMGQTYHLKRVASRDGVWWLVSDNPEVLAVRAPPDLRIVAVHVATVRPEDLAPPPGTRVTDEELAPLFRLAEPPSEGASRVDGHLFLLVRTAGALSAPDRIPIAEVRPGETAFVLTSVEPGLWTYRGVARQHDGQWHFPAVDFESWRRLGGGRSASRTLEKRWLERATLASRELADRRPPLPDARVLGPSPRGGIRIDGGPTGFSERTISLTDLGWSLAAKDDAAHQGGHVDEALVNRLRYLDGTPKESTRWIDTRWALALLAALEASA